MQLLEVEVTDWCQIERLLVQFNQNGRAHLIEAAAALRNDAIRSAA